MTTDPVFVRLSATSKVHVLEPGRPPRIALNLNREVTKSWMLAFGYIGTTYCGRNATLARGSGAVDTFPDDQLCVSCYRIYPGRKNALFDHPTEQP